VNRAVTAVTAQGVRTVCAFTGDEQFVDADSVVLVTARLPKDGLFHELQSREPEWAGADLRSVRGIGDAWAPSTIAAAVWSGHRYAEELDEPPAPGPVAFRREVTGLSIEPVEKFSVPPLATAQN
ncbi:MAG: NADH:flavin oxidoreductase, partial [Rhodococcus sp. (in: high G+C Gram-positive bacteria)]